MIINEKERNFLLQRMSNQKNVPEKTKIAFYNLVDTMYNSATKQRKLEL